MPLIYTWTWSTSLARKNVVCTGRRERFRWRKSSSIVRTPSMTTWTLILTVSLFTRRRSAPTSDVHGSPHPAISSVWHSIHLVNNFESRVSVYVFSALRICFQPLCWWKLQKFLDQELKKRNWSLIANYLAIVLLLVVGATNLKKPPRLRVNMQRLTESDFRLNVIKMAAMASFHAAFCQLFSTELNWTE